MRYTRSSDGKMRTSVRVILRLDRQDVEQIRRKLRQLGEPADDKAVRAFVNSCVDDTAVDDHWQDENEERDE